MVNAPIAQPFAKVYLATFRSFWGLNKLDHVRPRFDLPELSFTKTIPFDDKLHETSH